MMTNMEIIAKDIIKVQPRKPFAIDFGKIKRRYYIDSAGCWEMLPGGQEKIADNILRALITGDLAAEKVA